jgi:hypothetical protein
LVGFAEHKTTTGIRLGANSGSSDDSDVPAAPPSAATPSLVVPI